MEWWQIALLALGLVWLAQSVGTWVQMKHYRDVLSAVSSRWSDGFVGVGNARANLGEGVILLLVISPQNTVRKLLIMQGRSVFAKFRARKELEGLSVEALLAHEDFSAEKSGRQKALQTALHQIERARKQVEMGEEPETPFIEEKLTQQQS